MKRLVLIFGLALSAGFAVHAADVTARVTCADLKKQISSMDASDEKYASLQAQYRRQCSVGAAGRKSRAAAEVAAADPAQMDCNALQSQINTAADAAKLQTDAIATLTQLRAQFDEECANTCTTPDENGCCPGEVYTDMGADGFNCCPQNGGDCFPPMK